MRNNSIIEENEVYIASGVIAAHAYATEQGFRQRDAKFMVELFSNWMEQGFLGHSVAINNVQISRYLTHLDAEGFARKKTYQKRPHYRLTRSGLIELLSRITGRAYFYAKEQFYFLHYFLSNYREHIESIIEREGKMFPPTLKIEVQGLLNTEQLIEQEINFVTEELQKLDIRISDALHTTSLVCQLKQNKTEPVTIVKAIEKTHPYELNSQKPLSELLSDMSQEQQIWELEVGTQKRVQQMWLPLKRSMLLYLQELEKLRN